MRVTAGSTGGLLAPDITASIQPVPELDGTDESLRVWRAAAFIAQEPLL